MTQTSQSPDWAEDISAGIAVDDWRHDVAIALRKAKADGLREAADRAARWEGSELMVSLKARKPESHRAAMQLVTSEMGFFTQAIRARADQIEKGTS